MKLLWLVVVGICAWGVIEPRVLDVENERAEIPGLPPAWENRRVAQISDLQMGMWLDNELTVREAIERIAAGNPELVLITGDFVQKPGQTFERRLDQVSAMLKPLGRQKIPAYAVLGNHDYNMDEPEERPPDQELANALEQTLERIGIVVLRNEAVALAPPAAGSGAHPSSPGPTKSSGRLFIVGIGPTMPGRADPDKALSQVPRGAPRIVMMHNPDVFARLPEHAAPFAVAGHTHGGQVRLPFLPEWSWLTFSKSEAVHGDGWISGYGNAGNELYVNRGIGMSVVPIRINCMPELTWFTLQSGRS